MADGDGADAHSEHVAGREIVIAVDASTHSQYAVKWAASNVCRKDDAVTLITVLWIPPAPVSVSEKLLREAKDNAIEVLRNLREDIIHYVRTVRIKVLKGYVKNAVVGYVEVNRPDMLVVGSLGMGTERWWLGSVSDYCVHHCQCPVVVVKQEGDREEKKGSS